MSWVVVILAIGLPALLGANHVRSQGLKTTTPATTTTTGSNVHGADNATISIQVNKKEDSRIIDPFQDILFDPSLVVARVNRDIDDVSDEKSTWSAASNDAKDEESSNSLEDLDTQEDKYYSEPNWYRRQDWKVEEQKPFYKRESYNRFLKYPIFSGR